MEARGAVTVKVRTHKCSYSHKLPLYKQDVINENAVENVVVMGPEVRTQKCILPI